MPAAVELLIAAIEQGKSPWAVTNLIPNLEQVLVGYADKDAAAAAVPGLYRYVWRARSNCFNTHSKLSFWVSILS